MKGDAGLALLIIVIVFIISPFSFVIIQGDSMSPTIPRNSLLLTYDTKKVNSGDIVTFTSQETDQYITHRIINKTQDGFITKGDNNLVTDQKTGEPPIPRENIKGKAVTISGNPLYIPIIGKLLLILRLNIIATLLVLVITGILFYILKNRIQEHRVFGHLVAADIFQPILIVAIITLSLTFVLTASTITVPITYVGSSDVSTQQYVVQVSDTSQQETITIEHTKSRYTNQIYQVDKVELLQSKEISKTKTNLLVLVPPRKETGVLETTLTIYKYPAVLPLSILQLLTNISPIIPSLLTSIIVTSPFYLWYKFLIGPDTPIHSLQSVRIYRWIKQR